MRPDVQWVSAVVYDNLEKDYERWKARAEAAEARATTAEQERDRLIEVNDRDQRWIELITAERDALQAQKDAALALCDDFEEAAGIRFALDLIRAVLTDPPKAEPETGERA